MSYTPGDPPEEGLRDFLWRELREIADHVDRNRWEHSFRNVSTSYTAGTEPYVFADASSAALTVTLPEPSRSPLILNVKKTDSSANAVTVAATSIDGQATRLLTCQYESLTLYWDQSVWHIV